ncbi:MAG: LPS export ABC transporter periplasmic protein LptC [Desulfobulbaceae bacterium]|nr:LPS export ABC transporter periplasmic protein LptC [Desulfobulbaceae bacterium]
MIKNPRNLLWLSPLLLLLTSPFWRPPITAFLQPEGSFDDKEIDLSHTERRFVMDHITITITEHGNVEWTIQAKRSYTGETDQQIGMTNVNAEYVGKDGKKIYITSNRGTYYFKEKHLILMDEVVIDDPVENRKMTTELLHYYDINKMLVSPYEVRITTAEFSIDADRLDYDLISDAYELSGNVECQF